MNNRGMMTSLLAIGATGAAIYGITKGIQNGSLQKLPQTVSNALENQNVEQMAEPIQNMMNNQDDLEVTNMLQQIGENSQKTQ